MTHFTRRFFLQSLLAIPLVACSKQVDNLGNDQGINLDQFNIPLPVETLDKNFKIECKRKAEDFYKHHISSSDFAEQFEKLELEQFKNEQFVFLDGMCVTYIMAGFILLARSL